MSDFWFNFFLVLAYAGCGIGAAGLLAAACSLMDRRLEAPDAAKGLMPSPWWYAVFVGAAAVPVAVIVALATSGVVLR